jgi:hypothetical protein
VSEPSTIVSSSLPPLKDDVNILERYVDTLVGINFTNGIFNITFATVRTDHSVEPATKHRHITARLVLPLAAAAQLQTSIGKILATLRAQGAIQIAAPDLQTKH